MTRDTSQIVTPSTPTTRALQWVFHTTTASTMVYPTLAAAVAADYTSRNGSHKLDGDWAWVGPPEVLPQFDRSVELSGSDKLSS